VTEQDNVGRDQLRALAQRKIRLEEEKDALVSDIGEINAEAKALGYNTRALNAAIKKVRMTPEKRAEQDQYEMELSLYCDTLLGAE
jgi:uncharacterized protein (UPF0335 family)